jgi:hypothetical protein
MTTRTPDADKLTFRMWRRRVVEQIMARKAVELPPVGKLTAWSIGERMYDAGRVTTASSATIGWPVGLKPDEAQYGIDALVAVGHARIKRFETGTRSIRLLLRDDIEAPYLPVIAESAFLKTPAYMAFLSARAQFITDIFADPILSPTDKVIAFGLTRFIEVDGLVIVYPFKAIGAAVGYGTWVVKKSVGRLVEAGYFSKDRLVGGKAIITPAIDRGEGWGEDRGAVNSGSDDFTAISSPTSSDSRNADSR